MSENTWTILAVAVLSASIIFEEGAGGMAFAGQHRSDVPLEQQGMSAIQGSVVNAVTGMPVRKAHLMILPAEAGFDLQYRAESDAQGHFVITDIKPGKYWIWLEKKGFLKQQYGAGAPGSVNKIYTLSPGQQIRDILLRATPCSVITGKVLNEDGEPITGVDVQAMRLTYNGTTRQLHTAATAVTDDLGRYRLPGLVPGTYYAAASYNLTEESWGVIERTSSASNENYIRTFYPRTTDAAAALPIPVAAGMEVGAIDIDLVKSAGTLVATVTLSGGTTMDAQTEEQRPPTGFSDQVPAGLPEKSLIQGEIVNGQTGVPLKKAHLILRQSGAGFDVPYTAESDAQGRFTMSDIEPGRYRLWAEAKGFLGQEHGAGGPNAVGKVLTVKPSQHVEGVLFRVTPSAVIAGKVLDEDGEPGSGANVQAMRFSYQAGKRQLQVAGVTIADDLGEFRLHGLAPGNYYVAASCAVTQDSGATQQTTGSTSGAGCARTFYPRTTETAAAIPISVTAGAEVDGIKIWSIPLRGVRLTGHVLGLTAPRIAGDVVVTLIPSDLTTLAFSSDNVTGVDSQGGFDLKGVLPGSYVLSINWFSGNDQYVASQVLEVTNADIRDLRLVVSKAANLVGRVQIDGIDNQSFANLRIALEPESGGTASTLMGDVKPDGSFVMTKVPPLKYTVSVPGMSEDLYIKSLQVMGETLPDLTLDVRQVGGGPINVVLSTLGGVVRGHVVDEKQQPASGAQIGLVPDRTRRTQSHLYKTTITDANGEFKLVGISPGKYELFAWPNNVSDAYLDSHFLGKFEGVGKDVTVREKSNDNIILTLIPSLDEVP